MIAYQQRGALGAARYQGHEEFAIRDARRLAVERGAAVPPALRIGHAEARRDAMGGIHEIITSDVVFVPTGMRVPGAVRRALFSGVAKLHADARHPGTFYVWSEDHKRPQLTACWSLHGTTAADLHDVEVVEPGVAPRPADTVRRVAACATGSVPRQTPVRAARILLSDALHIRRWLGEIVLQGRGGILPLAGVRVAALIWLAARVDRSRVSGDVTHVDVDISEIVALEEADAAVHGFGPWRALHPARLGSEGCVQRCAPCGRIGSELLAARAADRGIVTTIVELAPTRRRRRRRPSKRRREVTRGGLSRAGAAAVVAGTRR